MGGAFVSLGPDPPRKRARPELQRARARHEAGREAADESAVGVRCRAEAVVVGFAGLVVATFRVAVAGWVLTCLIWRGLAHGEFEYLGKSRRVELEDFVGQLRETDAL